MPYVEQSIIINAPVKAVYQLVADQPERMAEWWPPIELQERVTPPPTETGSVSRYVYNMMGFKIKGEHEVVELDTGRHIVVKTTSGIDSTFDFGFLPLNEGDETELTIRVDYTLPGSMIGQLVNRFLIEEKNIRDLQEGLQNLKSIVEAEYRQQV